MESKLMPCKVADLIDVIISHNERVGIWVEYRNGDESGCALLWKGMAHELPRQHLNSRFVRIFGLIPETIMDADIINIIVEIPTPMTTSEPTTEIVDDLRFYLLVANKEKPTQLISTIARAADRLESQEQTISAMTARAEQAERERDAAVKDLKLGRGCVTCKHIALKLSEKPCKFCMEINFDGNYEWRGQPQDGEGKK